jgi:intracellular sulfur oxidation DsrE/DsrF family protein
MITRSRRVPPNEEEKLMKIESVSSHLVASVMFVLVVAVGAAAAQTPNDSMALAGVNQVKVAFDMTNGDAKALLNQLNVIGETRDSLIKQGVTPQFVIAFRGPATRLVQTDLEKMKIEDRTLAAKIAAKVDELSKANGVVLQQCSVAVRQQEVKPENVLPAITVIGNSWISLMAFQTKGFAYIHP